MTIETQAFWYPVKRIPVKRIPVKRIPKRKARGYSPRGRRARRIQRRGIMWCLRWHWWRAQ